MYDKLSGLKNRLTKLEYGDPYAKCRMFTKNRHTGKQLVPRMEPYYTHSNNRYKYKKVYKGCMDRRCVHRYVGGSHTKITTERRLSAIRRPLVDTKIIRKFF